MGQDSIACDLRLPKLQVNRTKYMHVGEVYSPGNAIRASLAILFL